MKVFRRICILLVVVALLVAIVAMTIIAMRSVVILQHTLALIRTVHLRECKSMLPRIRGQLSCKISKVTMYTTRLQSTFPAWLHIQSSILSIV